MAEASFYDAGYIVRKFCKKFTLYNNISHCFNSNTGTPTHQTSQFARYKKLPHFSILSAGSAV